MKPKPNPTTQARVDAHDGAAAAKAKADAAELTLARYHAQATQLGVQSIRFEVEPDGIVVVLRGAVDGRNVSVEVLAPKGQPLVLYAVSALDSFSKGMSTRTVSLTPNTPPDVPLPEPEPVASPLDYMPASTLANAERVLQDKARAAEIAKRAAHSQHGDIRKPAPAGAGQRKPLGLPLCKQCEAQPVYQPKAEFCGSACARRWHTDNAGRVAKLSR